MPVTDAIPEDVIADIFLRLPVKSLLRFKCLSGQWSSLFSSSRFNSRRVLHFSPTRLLLLQCRYPSGIRIFRLREDPSPEALTTPFACNKLTEIVGSCHGVVCMDLSGASSDLLVWNPVTRQVRHLPPPPPLLSSHDQPAKLGFGFYRSMNDFKVVRVLTVNPQPQGAYQQYLKISKIEVFARSRGNWGEIENEIRDLAIDLSASPLVMRGLIYWLAKDNENRFLLLSFDIENEVFSQIPAPTPERTSEISFVSNIMVLGGSLVVLYHLGDRFSHCYEVWRMDAATGSGQSWSLLLTIDRFIKWTRPVCFWRDSKILVNMTHRLDLSPLVSWDFNGGAVEHVGIGGCKALCRAHAHVETLVSVD